MLYNSISSLIIVLMGLFASLILNFEEDNRRGFCGIEKHNKQLYLKYPHLKPSQNKAFQNLENFTNDYLRQKKKNSTTNYVIPIVVHIVHDNGYEYIDDLAVVNGIADLNNAMKGNTQNNLFIDSSFVNLKSDTNIEFVLAKFDPEGNSTTGIIRHRSRKYTKNGSNENMRRDYHWPRHMYFNLYIVRKPYADEDASGFATFPYVVDDTQQAHLDGVVLAYWAFGRHSNLYNEWYYTVAHEVGHWLNLYHIWGAYDPACSADDELDDTPNTIGNIYAARSECNTSSFQCGSLDNITNHMDYAAPCQAMFTINQTDRMHAALNSSIAQRNNLHTPENLELTLGVLAGNICVDDFTDLSNTILSESTSTKISITTNGIIAASDSIALYAGENIKLQNGFKTETGATFRAYIAPCLNAGISNQ